MTNKRVTGWAGWRGSVTRCDALPLDLSWPAIQVDGQRPAVETSTLPFRHHVIFRLHMIHEHGRAGFVDQPLNGRVIQRGPRNIDHAVVGCNCFAQGCQRYFVDETVVRPFQLDWCQDLKFTLCDASWRRTVDAK